MQQLFIDLEYVILSHKRHFHVQLVKLARRTIRTCIFVSEARGNLEITIESRNHEQLLELLRRLGKCIELTGMDAVNASHYDGATALAEAVLMGLKNTEGHTRILLPRGLHPEYKEVIKTYLSAFECTIKEYSGRPADAAAALPEQDLAVLVASYPDFFGIIPELQGAAEAVHAKGGLFVVHADPIMLGLFKSPGAWGADVVTAEGQSLGNDLNYGGPFLGIMGTTNALVRRLPGRLVGETKDSQGRRGFVLTLVAREQHIRREKAVSNICSNQGLMALRSCIYLAMMGRQGLREAAELCWHNAHFAARKIAEIPGFSVEQGLFFKEFVVRTPIDADPG